MTTPQRRALEQLTALLCGADPIPCDRQGNIRTGCHTLALLGLCRIGAISCSTVFARGWVTPDVKIHHALTPSVDRDR